MKKVYFGINGQFGDIIIQEPSLRKFIKDNPDTKIILGCYKKYAGALELYEGYHDNIIGFKIWDGYNDWPTKSDKHYIEMEKFDFMFETMPKQKEPDWARKYHQTVASARMQNLSIEESQISLPLVKNIKNYKNTVAISLFPNWPHGGVKSLPYDWVCNIVKVLNKIGLNVIHLNGPGEPDIPNAKKINGSYVESVRHLLGTDFLVTCDTGMSWVASAYQHPTVGIYAWGYNPVAKTSKNWQPVNPNAIYIENYRAIDIPKANIVQALVKMRKNK